MMPAIKGAIGRLRAIRGDGGEVFGTAFIVSGPYLLTAFHVVGDKEASAVGRAPLCYPELWFSPAGDDDLRISVKVVTDACDPISDWALLEATAPLARVFQLATGEVSQWEVEQRRKLEFECWGFPALAEISGSGIAINGELQDLDARYQGAWAYQLFSYNAAAAHGDPLNGLSGAPCIIDGAVVGIIRSNLVAKTSETKAEKTHIVGGILYACPLATETLQERCAAYLPRLDPIRGLPGLPRQDLPVEPFRYLRWYGAEHAEVLFGRNRKLRDLYFQVTSSDGPNVVLVYGASGVGKSSVLEAGLLPRLSIDWEIRAQRREVGKKLAASFDFQLTSAQRASRVNAKPILIILDQIEEVFTDSKADGDAELRSLGERLRATVKTTDAPTKIILGFRSEWLANVRARLAEAGIPVSEFYLERLSREEIEEVVRGVTSTNRLRRFYDVEVDAGLPRRVADDLLADPASPVSPVLSIILTWLWAEAKTHHAGMQHMREDVYDERMRSRLDLDRFLAEQLKAVELIIPSELTSGLVTDMLYRHTTDHGTAKELSWRELRETYHQLSGEIDQELLRSVVSALSAQSLLYTAEKEKNWEAVRDETQHDEQTTRLAHDTLAPPVRKHYQRSDLPGQRAERRLTSWLEAWDPSHPELGTLDATGLALIKQGADGTRGWTEKERTFIQASEAAERLERRRAWQSRALVALLFAAVVAIPLAWWKGAWLDEQAYRYIHVQALTTSQEGALTPSGTAFKECTHCPAMVVVPAGKFVMGGPPDGKGDNQEYPQHDVAITRPFAVAQFEVSWDEWNVCARHGNCISDISTSGWEGRRRPVINVTWRDAQEYVGWLRRITGKHYRLLTEAEWEYAARANETQSTHFPFDDKQLGDYAWYEANSDGQTHPVGEKKLNPFGLGDMHGNVAEWVEDCFHENYNGAPSDGSAWSGNCNRRVIRGGHWQMRVRALRSASREWEVIDKRSNYVGFRVARSLAP